MRGRNAVSLSSGLQLSTLNQPRNVAKGDFGEMSWVEIFEKLREEYNELHGALWRASQGDVESMVNVCHEAADLANCCSFATNKAITELIHVTATRTSEEAQGAGPVPNVRGEG